MTAIWREDRQPNFDPFGRSMRIVTPPNTPANASHCTSNAPLPSQSFVSIQSLYCGPWGDPLRRQFAHFQHWFPRPSLVHDHISTSNWPSNAALVIPKQDDDRDFDLKKTYEQAGGKKIHSPFIGRACLNPEFTGGNYLQSGIPKFPISVFPPLLVGRIPDFWIYHSPRRKGIRYKEGWWTSWRWWIWIWPRRTFRANVLRMSLSNLFPFYFNFFLQCNIHGQCPRIWRVKISWVQAGIKNYPMHVTVALL